MACNPQQRKNLRHPLDDRCVTGPDISVKKERTPMQKAPRRKSPEIKAKE
jgi:hypothetical protein